MGRSPRRRSSKNQDDRDDRSERSRASSKSSAATGGNIDWDYRSEKSSKGSEKLDRKKRKKSKGKGSSSDSDTSNDKKKNNKKKPEKPPKWEPNPDALCNCTSCFPWSVCRWIVILLFVIGWLPLLAQSGWIFKEKSDTKDTGLEGHNLDWGPLNGEYRNSMLGFLSFELDPDRHTLDLARR